MNANNVVLTIDMGKRCAECRKPGATPSGICMACANKALAGKTMKSEAGRKVQQRFLRTR